MQSLDNSSVVHPRGSMPQFDALLLLMQKDQYAWICSQGTPNPGNLWVLSCYSTVAGMPETSENTQLLCIMYEHSIGVRIVQA